MYCYLSIKHLSEELVMKQMFVRLDGDRIDVDVMDNPPLSVEVQLTDEQRQFLKRLNLADIMREFARAGFKLCRIVEEAKKN